MQRPPSPYDVLNVAPGAEPEVIEAAYKALMKKYHPDKLAGAPARKGSEAAALNTAYKLLRNKSARARYDAEERARQPVKPADDWTFDGARGGAPFTPRPADPAASQPRPPAAPSPPRYAGRRAAGWIAIAIAVGAVGLAYATTSRPQAGLGARVAAAAADVAVAAEGDRPPLNQRAIGEALARFERIRALYGSSGVAAYSDACFDAQRRTRDLGDLDFCVAFDHAASAFDAPAEPFRIAPPRFSETQLALRHSGAARLQPQDYEALEDRLTDIRTLTYSAISAKAKDAAEPAPAARSPAPRRAARPVPVRRAAAPKPRPTRPPPRPRQERDFLEREGGIY